MFRRYVLDRQITVGRHKAVRVIAWPPGVGVSHAGKLADFISTVVRRIDEQLDRIVADSLPIIEKEILAFCEPSEAYHPPSAEQLMAESQLTMLKINADGEHEIEFSDRADLVGGHDILIQLDSTLTPTYTYMDG